MKHLLILFDFMFFFSFELHNRVFSLYELEILYDVSFLKENILFNRMLYDRIQGHLAHED